MQVDDIGEDIAGDIRATMAELKGEPAPVVETPSAEVSAEPVAETPPVETREDGRDEKGRFKAKEQQAEAIVDTKSTPQQGAVAAATGTEPVAPPAKWEPQAKADFMALPPQAQKQVLAMVEAADKANADWQPKAQTYAMIEQVIAPQREAWARAGMSEAQALAGLVQAQQMLDQNPISGLVQIARSYGLTREDWLAAAGVGPEQGDDAAAQTPATDPRLNALAQQVQTLTQTLTQRHQAEQQQAQQTIQQQIDEFARDPKHIYFENVKPLMAALMKSGQAQDLATAYGMATRAHPEVSKLVLAQETASKAAADKAALAEKKKASVSVVGSPGQRGQVVNNHDAPAGSNLSHADEIRAAARKALTELRT